MKKFYSIAAILFAVLTTFTSCGSKEDAKAADATAERPPARLIILIEQ